MGLYVWDYINTTVVVFLVGYLFHKTLRSNYKGKEIFPFGIVILSVFNISVLVLGGSDKILLYINIALYLLFAWYICAGSGTKRILWACNAAILVMIADMTSSALADMLYFDNLSRVATSAYTDFYISSAFILLASGLIIITAKIGVRFGNLEYRLSLPQNVLVIAVTILCAVLTNMLKDVFSFEGHSGVFLIDEADSSVVAILYSSILGTLYIFISAYAKSKQHNYENRMEIDHLSFEIEHYRQNEMSIKSLRELRHDISTHMHVMKTLAQQGKNEELVEYFNSINDKHKKDNTMFLTNNSMLNAMLTSKANVATKDNIEIELTYNTQKDIPLAYPEFCALFGNLLDNAIEANRKVPVEEKRYIDLSVGDKGEMVFIKIENAADGHYLFDDGELETTKKDSKHGIGLRRVKEIAEQVGGFFDINPQPDKFIAFVMLPPVDERGNDYD